MIGGDVRDDADLVGLVAHASQHEPAASRLEDGDVEVGPAEDLPRAARAGPVAGLDHSLVDEHAVGGRRADPPLRQHEDVGRQASDGALAVRARDRDDRDPPVGVADPRRRRRPGIGDRRLPAGNGARRRRTVAGRTRGRDIPLGQGDRRLGNRVGPLGAGPRERDDPVSRIRRAMDDDAGAALAVVDAQSANPVDDPLHRARPFASRDGRAQPDQRMSARLALPGPRPPPADGDLDLDHRRKPVDVRTLEQADLDQAHGPARIASGPDRRLPVMETATAPGTGVTEAELAAID